MRLQCDPEFPLYLQQQPKPHFFLDGPKDLSIKVHSKNCLVIATCTVDDVKPFSSDLVQWGGLCQGQRGTVCTFTSRGEEDNGKEVTCTVINQANNGHIVSSRAKVTVSGREQFFWKIQNT